MDSQGSIVASGKNVKEVKKLAQQNDSVIAKLFWDIDFDQVCVLVLHVILRITKMFDMIIFEIKIYIHDRDRQC